LPFYPYLQLYKMADGGVGIAGLIIAVPGVIDICIRYGQFLKTRTHNYRHIEAITRLSRFIVDLVEGEVRQVLRFFEAMHNDSIQDHQTNELVQQLHSLLEEVSRMFSGDTPGTWERFVFSMKGKKSIDRACAELEGWHARFLRHFWIRAMLGSPDLPAGHDAATTRSRMLSRVQRVKSAIMSPDKKNLRLEAFDDAVTLHHIPGSNVAVTDVGRELVEFREYPSLATAQVMNTTQALVRDLAVRLHEIEPSTMGLLRCNGYTAEPARCRFALRLQYPAGKDSVGTLHSLLVHEENSRGVQHSLGDRVLLARKLASAVLYMHTCDFVHKNIRPDNVLIFTDDVPPGEDSAEYTYPRVIGEPFLVGFDNVRKAIAASNMIKVEDWKKNIYLHPDRHRMGAGDEYTVRHDVYSLGVVLLEIAMWGSFTDQRPRKMARYVWQDDGTQPAAPLSPEDLKERYLKLAKSVVPRQIGTKYADIVVSCLEGLQDEERGGLLNDEDGLVIETAYVAQVLSKLEEISL
jgi:hypothetical protein